MRYLLLPNEREELVVRGRYAWTANSGDTEVWELYRNSGSPMLTLRSEWHRQVEGADRTILAHAVIAPDGLERLKLKLMVAGAAPRRLTLTFDRDSVLVHDENNVEEMALPPGYGVVLPQPSLARFAFPFDLSSDDAELAMTLLLRIGPGGNQLTRRLTKFAYQPKGYRELRIAGTELRAKGWRMEVPGLLPREAWFDRQGVCVAMQIGEGDHVQSIQLTEWTRFG